MTRLFLIRHGRPEAAWGGAGTDPGLSVEGHQQAADAAGALGAEGALHVVSSPMRRCRETAVPYARLRGVEPAVDQRVSEIVADDGVADRAAWLQARFPWRDPGNVRTWASLEPRLHQWRARMLEFVSSIRADTAVFSHFIAINVMVGAAMRNENTIVCMPDHASITELAVENGMLTLVRLGATMRVDDVR